MNIRKNISHWLTSVFVVWRHEFRLVFGDVGVLLFFFGLPLMYPILYTAIYNPEVVKDIPIVVVDQSRTTQSRELARMLDATDAMALYDYAVDMPAARRLMAEHKCYGILLIPDDYARNLGSSQQAVATFYTEMDLLLRYRTITSALADIQIALGAKIQAQTADNIGLLGQGMAETPVNNEAIMLGDPAQGFASFVMPGIVVMILQQSLVLGICMLMGGHRERLRRVNGIDPQWIDAPAGASLTGKALCYLVIYIPMTYYILHLLPRMFDLQQIGDMWQAFSFITPLLIASVFFGQCISQFVKDRETAMLVVVFTSVIFLFLSGLTWPRYAMNPFLRTISAFIPSTWGVEGFIHINNNGSSITEQIHPYTMLWALAGLYFLVSYTFTRLARPKDATGRL